MRNVSPTVFFCMSSFVVIGCGDADPYWNPEAALYADKQSTDDVENGIGGCEGACEYQLYSECTCAADDPCGWSGDGYCDAMCYLVTGDARFDDGDDCTGVCGGLCDLEIYSPCTCDVDDPCGWAGDEACDALCYTLDGLDNMFDDSADCTGTCDGHCEVGLHSACTCGVDDPCGWKEDGYCDSPCLEIEGLDDVFDDSVDCGEVAQEK